MLSSLRKFIKEALIREIDIEEISPEDAEHSRSTHVMKTFKLNGEDYYLKFSEEELFEDTNPSLQILNEFLAYNIYKLYPGVSTPSKIELVFDKTNKVVGLATSAVKGRGTRNIRPQELARKLSAGIFVDVFLANWDVVAHGNVIASDDDAIVRIDPGGSMAFRARGGRKGSAFSKTPSELKTMFDPDFGGSGFIFQHADLRAAADSFLSVSWNEISSKISEVSDQITKDLTERGMDDLAQAWSGEAEYVTNILRSRHAAVEQHAKSV